MSAMLLCIRSGFTTDWDGSLVEFTAGRDRVDPGVLAERPQFADFFDAGVRARGICAESRAVVRTTAPDGTVLADERFG